MPEGPRWRGRRQWGWLRSARSSLRRAAGPRHRRRAGLSRDLIVAVALIGTGLRDPAPHPGPAGRAASRTQQPSPTKRRSTTRRQRHAEPTAERADHRVGRQLRPRDARGHRRGGRGRRPAERRRRRGDQLEPESGAQPADAAPRGLPRSSRGLRPTLGPRGRAVDTRRPPTPARVAARAGRAPTVPAQLRRRGISRPSCVTCAGLRSPSVCTPSKRIVRVICSARSSIVRSTPSRPPAISP